MANLKERCGFVALFLLKKCIALSGFIFKLNQGVDARLLEGLIAIG